MLGKLVKSTDQDSLCYGLEKCVSPMSEAAACMYWLYKYWDTDSAVGSLHYMGNQRLELSPIEEAEDKNSKRTKASTNPKASGRFQQGDS